MSSVYQPRVVSNSDAAPSVRGNIDDIYRVLNEVKAVLDKHSVALSSIRPQVLDSRKISGVSWPHIPYVSADGVLSDTTMHWDAANERLGIGTASPARLLSLYGTSPYLQLSNSNSGVGAGDGLQLQLVGLAGYLWNFENGPLCLGTNNSACITISANGNVGIGTTSPSDLLSIFVNQDSGTLATGNAIYAEIDQESGATISAESWLFKGKGDWDGTTTGTCGGMYMELLSGHDYGIYIKEGAGSGSYYAYTLNPVGFLLDSDSNATFLILCGDNRYSTIHLAGKDAGSLTGMQYSEADGNLRFIARSNTIFTLDVDSDIEIASSRRIKFPDMSTDAKGSRYGWIPVKVRVGLSWAEFWIPCHNVQ